VKRPSILLNEFAGWNPALLDHVELVDDGAALRLRLLPGVARPLTSGDGTFGGFTNPVGLAVDCLGRIYVLDIADCVVKRFDPCLQAFQVLPCVGGRGGEARRLNDPHGIAISGREDLFIADTGNWRVPVYSVKGLALRTVLGPYGVKRDANGIRIEVAAFTRTLAAAGTDCYAQRTAPDGVWVPYDVAVSASGWLYVADYGNGLIHVFDPHLCWRAAYDGSSATSPALTKPVRLALDQECRIYIVQEGADHVVVLDKEGEFVANIAAPEDVKGRFCSVAVAVDGQGDIHIVNQYAAGIAQYRLDDNECYCCVSQSSAPAAGSADLIFDLQGNPIAVSGIQVVQLPAAAIYEPEGTFVTDALDSRVYRCSWHRVVMQAAIAVGTQVSVETFTAEDKKTPLEVLGLPDERWTSSATNSTVGDCHWDCLVQSPPGRYLWLRLKFFSDGQNTPCIDWLRIFYPRASSLQYLPAAYSDDGPSRQFLDQFLSIFDTLRDGIGGLIGRIAAYFDPMATLANPKHAGDTDFLSWLASWVGLTLDRHWPEARRRKLLKNAWKLYNLRGTPAGLRLHLQLYTGIEPQILEHFKLRRWLSAGSVQLGDQSTLWGADVVNRLQLDVHAQLNTVQLIDTGDPATDPFSKEAYQFTVFVPQRGQISIDPQADALQQQTVQRIIEMSKPAHTLGYLQMTRPRFRVGIQAFIGKDTVVGSYPNKVVESQSKLGYDSTLGQAPEEQGAPAMRVGRSTRIGANTLLN
jgi:phage tail-like protein